MPNNKGRNPGKKSKMNKQNKASVPRTPAARSDGQQRSLLQKIKGMLPTFHGKQKVGDENIDGGLYKMYKEATLRFHNWMAHEACPDLKMSAIDDYRKGVDWIIDRNMKVYSKQEGTTQVEDLIVAPPEIMASLVSSIRLREKVTANLFESKGGGDLGHQYIIDVLKYCRSSLRFGNRIAAVCKARHDDEQEVDVQDALGGRFHALSLDDDDSEQEVDVGEIDRDIKNGNVPKYAGVQVEEEIDIKEGLLKGDDRFQAMVFFYILFASMKVVHDQYVLLKEYMRGLAHNHESSSCMQLLMECAAVANAATECVNRAENEMAIDHPHLSSFYHVLALVALPDYIADINKKIDKTKLKTSPHMALRFVAEIVEAVFFQTGRQEKVPLIHKNFVKRSGLDLQYVEQIASCVECATYCEIISESELRRDPIQAANIAAAGLKPHTWFSQIGFIGGDYSILNTQKMIQLTMGFVSIKRDNQRIALKQTESSRLPFDEDKRPARRILGDLDEPFMARIIPELVEICSFVPFDTLPDRSYLITVLDLFQSHLKGDRSKPVPMALTFGLHAVLMSIFVLQGDGDLARVAAYSKQSYNMLFKQLETVTDRSKEPENSPFFYDIIEMFSDIATYAKPPTFIKDAQRYTADDLLRAEMLTFWNPLVGGEYMLYATYICSIGLGSATVNSMGQLKSALHLYNGLKVRDPKFVVPFLHSLDTLFKDAKAVWVGGKPDKGSCYKAFWMASGVSASRASNLTASEHALNKDVFLGDKTQPDDLRDLLIPPEEFSISYRRLVQRDLGNRSAQSIEGPAAAKKQLSFLDDLLTTINNTRDAMGGEKDTILPMNFSAVGSLLLEFVNALSDHMGWTRRIKAFVRNTPGVAFDMKFKLGCLLHDWGHILLSIDRDTTEQLDPHHDVDKIAAFTKSFFDKIEKSRYVFFAEEEKITTVTQRNPLEVSYPYGRTGRTLRDPLQAYWSFGHTKSGRWKPRLIVPGSFTPLGGLPLYVGENKLKLGSRGKYRHIASYSLAELLDLKWDGSLYSSQGSHSANGLRVPYIPGYDSDSGDEYEPINIKRGTREGTIGLSDAQVGLVMSVPGAEENGEPRLVRLKQGKVASIDSYEQKIQARYPLN